MKRYIFILIINLIAINLYSSDLAELSGSVEFKETQKNIGNTRLNIMSLDLSLDTTIIADSEGFYKISLPTNQYRIMISNDSLIGFSSVNLNESMIRKLIAYYNPNNDYKIFRNGFQQIFTSINSKTLGLKSNGEFRRTTFVGNYAAYSFTENGLYEIKGDSIIIKTLSIDSYSNIPLTGHTDYYIKKEDANIYLTDKNNIKYNLIRFNELDKRYNKK